MSRSNAWVVVGVVVGVVVALKLVGEGRSILDQVPEPLGVHAARGADAPLKAIGPTIARSAPAPRLPREQRGDARDDDDECAMDGGRGGDDGGRVWQR